MMCSDVMCTVQKPWHLSIDNRCYVSDIWVAPKYKDRNIETRSVKVHIVQCVGSMPIIIGGASEIIFRFVKLLNVCTRSLRNLRKPGGRYLLWGKVPAVVPVCVCVCSVNTYVQVFTFL